MSPVRIALIAVVAAIYIGLLVEVFRTKEISEKAKDGEEVSRPSTTKDKVFMVIAASGIGGLLIKYIVEWE